MNSETLKELKYIILNKKLLNALYTPPKVEGVDSTMDKLLSGRISMSRFGDGEYKVMRGMGNGFQKPSQKLGRRLREIIKMNGAYDDYIVCIPNIPNDYELLNDDARGFWQSFMYEYGWSWYRLLNFKSTYYDTQVTRLYYDWKSKDRCAEWFDRIKKLWDGQNVLIVEGEKTRLGVGNDLFDNTRSIERISCPSNNAFEHYDEILNEVKKQPKDKLVLIALGQTATVLAYDLYKAGYWAVDIGHIDIEYEWFLQKATKKIPIKGKYVKEAQELDEVDEIENSRYNSEVIAKII